MSLSKKTVETYNFALTKLKSINIDIDNPNLEDLLKYFEANSISTSSQNVYLSALNNHLKSLKKDTTVIISLINSNMCIIITNYQRNELSDREVKNFVPWSIIVEVYKLLGGTITNDRCYEDYILLSLYIHHPPRRSDYCNMLISDMDISAYKSRI